MHAVRNILKRQNISLTMEQTLQSAVNSVLLHCIILLEQVCVNFISFDISAIEICSYGPQRNLFNFILNIVASHLTLNLISWKLEWLTKRTLMSQLLKFMENYVDIVCNG